MTQPQPPRPPQPPPRPYSQPPRPPSAPQRPQAQAAAEEQSHGGALIAGALAALGAAVVWALITKWTDTEWGWIAWGVGLAVGLAMARSTPARGSTLAIYAALLAMLGLATGKVLTLKMMAGSAHEEIVKDETTLVQAFMIDMRERETFSPDVNRQIAAVGEDTLPDALFATMHEEARVRMEAAAPAERERVAKAAVTFFMGNLSLTQQLFGTFGLFDLLWFFLAIGTAWKIMKE